MAIADLFLSGEQGGWYDPSDISTLWQDTGGTSAITADGQLVARIDDKSGNGNHLTQATASDRPLYKTDGVLHWLDFDGVDDLMLTSAAMDISLTDEVTHAMSVETGAEGLNTFANLGGSNSAGEFGLTTNVDSQLSGIIRGTSASAALWTLSDIALTQKNVFVQSGKIATDRNQVRADGVQVAEKADDLGTGNMASASLYVVSSGPNFFTGKLYQLVVRNALTEDAALTTLEDDLRIAAGHTFSYVDGSMFVEVFGNSSLNVHISLGDVDKYITWRCNDYDTTGEPDGGGAGSVLKELYYQQRSGDTFSRIHRLTDVGLNEFAMKKDDGTDQHLGHDLHYGMARRASPILKIDDVSQVRSTRSNYTPLSKVEVIEYFECYDITDGTTVIANLDTTKTWENGTLKLKQEITFTVNTDMLVMYLCMFSLYREYDNTDSLGEIAETVKMPDYDNDVYELTTSIDATYPDAHHFKTSTNHNSKLAFDIEVQGVVPSEFRSWVQGTSSSTKFYLTPIGQRDTFGLIAERIPFPVVINDSFTMETWITPTLEASMNTIKLWKGAVEPASAAAAGNEYKAWRGAVEPAGVPLVPNDEHRPIFSEVFSSPFRSVFSSVFKK